MIKSFTRLTSLFLPLLIGTTGSASAQQSNLSCSQAAVPFINGSTPVFTVTESNSSTGPGGWTECPPFPLSCTGAAIPARVVDGSTTNFATGTIALTGSLTISVADAANVYTAGNFAGFVVRNGGVIGLSALNLITVTTYRNDSLQESFSGGSLVALSAGITDAYEVGFYTDKSFDEVELTIDADISASSYDVFYAILRGTGSCSSPPLACNTSTPLSFPPYGAVVSPARTGTSGIALSAVANAENAVDEYDSTHATITTSTSALGSAFLSVKDAATTYPAGTYAGFDLENAGLLDVNLLANVTIRTYLDGVAQEAEAGAGLLLGASVLSTSGRQTIGFVTDQPFDEVQLVISQPASVSLGATLVYGAVLKNFCAGPALSCNVPTTLADSAYPVYIRNARTGISGGACVGCTVYSTGNVIDGDPASFSVINLTAGALSGGSISVQDALGEYPPGTFAGFDIENPTLLNATVLSNLVVSTYRNDTLQESFTGNTLLLGVGTDLLFGPGGRTTAGGVATQAFDEVRISAVQTAGVDLGITKVYGVVLTAFCEVPLACDSTVRLNAADHPVFIDARHTGITGVACVLCEVDDAENAISADSLDYAQLEVVVGALSSASLSVRNAASTYPPGTVAGYVVSDPVALVEATLLDAVTIRTYNNGVLQEARSGGALLNLSVVLAPGIPVSDAYRLGFVAALPFDEIQISVEPVAGVAPILNVYGAFINTGLLDSVSGGQLCPKPPVAEPDHVATIVDVPLNGNLKTNDRDPLNGVLVYNTTPTSAPLHGSATIAANGTFTYTPAAGYTGSDSFRYTVCNAALLCVDQWAYISILPPRTPGGTNRPPIAQNDLSQTKAGIPVGGYARNNDSDPDGDSLTYTTIAGPGHGVLALNSNGTYTYTPDSSFAGTDTAILQICDNRSPALCLASVLLLEVTPDRAGPANDPPFAQDDVTTTPAGVSVSGRVLTNDSDPNGDPLAVTALDAVPAAQGNLYLSGDGRYTFQPSTGYTGTLSVRYAVCDNGTPALCDTATLTITVQPITGPDFTPFIAFDSTAFGPGSAPRDFVVSVTELLSATSNGQVVLRILKPSAFTITYSTATTSSSVAGATAVQNSNWGITQNGTFITCTLAAGATISGGSTSRIGFSIVRKAGVPNTTMQNITATIVNSTGGDSNNGNNQHTQNLTAR